MKDHKAKTRSPILAAGGIVLRGDRKPQFAVVQLRKMGAWVLPKGKLAANEDALEAARREVLEETGHRVTIHEFLGTLAYEASGRPKVVQFWRMQAIGEPVRDLMRDVKAIQWLTLEDAIEQLTHVREQIFLEQVGPIALKFTERSMRRSASMVRPVRKRMIERAQPVVVPNGDPVVEPSELAQPDAGGPACRVPAAGVMAAAGPIVKPNETDSEARRNLIEKTWVWFRDATLAHWPRLD